MPVAGERAEGEPIIQTATHDNMPTIMVLVKEDYEWARAFLKEFNYRKAVRRATARHLYSASLREALVLKGGVSS